MRIAYFDEAGTSSEEQPPYLVIGGALIHGDVRWQPIEIRANEIIETLVPPEIGRNFFFHATRLFSDHKSFKKLLSREDRWQLLREVLRIIVHFELPISYGAVSRADLAGRLPDVKPTDRKKWAHEMAFILCAYGFQGWFHREHGDEVAICVADRIEEKRLPASLKKEFTALRQRGLPPHPLVMLFNFVDALHFAASEESIGLQLADAAAFVIKRHLMGKADTEEFYKLIDLSDSGDDDWLGLLGR
ncbi:MAG: DUF3800 domain-containing protein [Candidatus Binataceae bacterium]